MLNNYEFQFQPVEIKREETTNLDSLDFEAFDESSDLVAQHQIHFVNGTQVDVFSIIW